MSSEQNSNLTALSGVSYPKLSKISLLVGLVGLAIAGIAFVNGVQTGDQRPLFGWLIGLSYWLCLGVGMLFLTMIWYLFDAGWPVIIRRQYEHALEGFKWLFLLFLPLLAVAWGWNGAGGWDGDPGLIWQWMNPDKEIVGGGTVAQDVLYQGKSAFLNVKAFTIGFFVFFGIWIGLSAVMRHSSYMLDKTGDIKYAKRPRLISTFGVIFCALGSTAAAIYWYMSIEYHWFSTMYGVWFFAESMRSALAASVVIIFVLSTRGYLKGMVNPSHYYFLGCLMLAFTMFWTYISFSQYFLIYNANIPEETFWYNLRELSHKGDKNSWWYVSMVLIFGQFLLPFLCLLFYKTKVIAKRLVVVACWMLLTHTIDVYWNILPGKVPDDSVYGYHVREFSIQYYDVAMILGVGGIMVWSFLRNAARQKPIPVRDPRILESLNSHE